MRGDPGSGVTLEPLEDMSHLRGTLKGPPDSPYEKGVFVVDIQIPSEYPFKPPKMRFETRVYHPNVSSQTGAICLDVLKDAWTPILTMKSSLLSLQSLLQSPQPDDPQDAVVAQVMINDPERFAETARHWTGLYAESTTSADVAEAGVSPSEIDSDAVSMFVEMGFDAADVQRTLQGLGLRTVRSDDFETQDLVIKKLSSI